MGPIVQVRDLIGVPFVLGGRDPTKGLDCFGLLMEVHARLGKTIPDYRSPRFHHEMEAALTAQKEFWIKHWERIGDEQCPLTLCKPGTSLLIRVKGMACHVGFVHEPGRFIHTWEDTSGVTSERLSLWKQRILGVYEFDG